MRMKKLRTESDVKANGYSTSETTVSYQTLTKSKQLAILYI